MIKLIQLDIGTFNNFKINQKAMYISKDLFMANSEKKK